MSRCVGQRTVEYCTDERSCEIRLLREVQPGWDLWSVGIIGPGCSQRVRHGLDMCDWRVFGEGRVGGSEEAGQTIRTLGYAVGYKRSRIELKIYDVRRTRNGSDSRLSCRNVCGTSGFTFTGYHRTLDLRLYRHPHVQPNREN